LPAEVGKSLFTFCPALRAAMARISEGYVLVLSPDLPRRAMILIRSGDHAPMGFAYQLGVYRPVIRQMRDPAIRGNGRCGLPLGAS